MAKASYREGLRLWQEMQQVEQRLGIVKGLAGRDSSDPGASGASRATVWGGVSPASGY